MASPSGRGTPSSSNRRESMQPPATNTTSVKVVLRIRPQTESSNSNVPPRFQRTVIHPVNPTTLQVEQAAIAHAGATAASAANLLKNPGKTTFTFDRVIGPDEGQPSVYDCAEPLVDSFMEGMNSTILAYGQTSSGKSYTMGTDRTSDADDDLGEERLGITPRAVASIFERIRTIQKETNGRTTFQAKLSYLEIYEEALIDLLAGDADVRPTVQIREDKEGNIIWSGLREVKVSNALEVMELLTAGSSLRQTSATGMNSQSSRSHAIFSLTLVQRKYTGSGAPPSTPTVTPSRFSNRMSALPRVSSPTPGARAGTPTHDRPSSRFGLRPPSSLGGTRSTSPIPPDESPIKESTSDSWVTITSKFHFVDLAGSERLKRTAAQGDRVKEGISINSGLHALGNVISALGDPARARQTTHIPYRDSKLTRLLQDSLGGNATTMMIACVSPTEFNLNETLSTLKYANRARNIKNRAEINEVEVGWDDVEYLQRTILRLRAELAAIHSGDGVTIGMIVEEGRRKVDSGAEPSRALQDQYSDLTQRYAQLTAELAKAQSGLSSSSYTGSSLSREDFAKAVEPIVEEYERSLSALESQLSLTKAALAHAEEEMRDMDEKLREEAKNNEARAVLIGELRQRISKQNDRESTTEAYVRDLEGRLKDVDHEGENHGSAFAELRKELAKIREQSATTEGYCRELEDKLTKSDETSSHLLKQVEILERDIKRREEAYRDLEGRLSLLDTSGEHKLLLAELDDRDRRLVDLERSYDELKLKSEEVEQEAERLEQVTHRETEEKELLKDTIRSLESKERATVPTPPATPHSGALAVPTSSSNDPAVATLAAQISQLQASYNVTLGELEAANAKYQASLQEIHDLQSQVDEHRLLRSDPNNFVTPSSSPNRTRVPLPKPDDDETEVLLPTVPTASSQVAKEGRPQLRTRRSMPLAPQARLSFLGRAGVPSPTSQHTRSASLSQERSAAQGLQSFSVTSPALSPGRRDSRSDWSPGATDRSYDQLNEEIMKLQRALSEREAEISALESNLHEIRRRSSVVSGTEFVVAGDGHPRSATNGTVTPLNGVLPPTTDLSPNTLAAFEALKADLVNSTMAGATLSVNDSLRLEDLMRVMAKKESTHRESIEQLEDQLASLRRQHEDLTVLSRDQVVNMSSEIEGLRAQLDGRPDSGFYESRLDVMRRELDTKSAQLEEVRRQAELDLSSALAKLTQKHQLVVDSNKKENEALLLQIKEEHSELLRRTLSEREDVLRQKGGEYAAALKSQAVEHAAILQLRTVDHEAALQAKSEELEALRKRRADEHAESNRRFELERSVLVDSEKDTFATTLEQLHADHAAVLEKRDLEFAAAADKLQKDHAFALSTRDTTHSSALNSMRSEHESTLTELLTGHSENLNRLREDHEASVRSISEKHTLAISTIKAEHDAVIKDVSASFETRHADLVGTHAQELETLKSQHQSELESIKLEHSATIEERNRQYEAELEARLASVVADRSSTFSALSVDHDNAKAALVEEHSMQVSTLLKEHESVVVGLRGSQEEALQQQHAAHERAVSDLVENHSLTSTSMRAALQQKHEANLADLAAELATTLDRLSQDHDQKLASLDSDHKKALMERDARHQLETESFDEQVQQMATELDDVRNSHQQLLSAYTALYSEHATLNNSLGTSKAEHDELFERFTSLSKRHDALVGEHELELAALQDALQQALSRQKSSTKEPDHQATAIELQEALDALSTLEKALLESQQEREGLLDRLDQLTLGHDEKERFDSALKEVESYRTSVLKLEADLTRTRVERDELSTQLARMSGSGLGHADPNGSNCDSDPRSVTPDRNGRGTPPTRQDSRSGTNGTVRLPPPTPPPSMPLPSQPAPRAARSSSSSSLTMSRNSNSMESTTTAGTSLRSPNADSALIDPRVAKRFEEQEAQIAKLAKQLSHTESDLQANIDLVNTLESALNDSERNLRKARTQMNDIARERDTFATQNEELRRQVVQAESETEAVRNSVLQVETRLQEERQGKERAKAELEARLEDVNRRKSKYACF